MKTVYQCEYCLETYGKAEEAMQCEMKCLKLTWPEYIRYVELVNQVIVARRTLLRNPDSIIQGFVADWEDDLRKFKEKHGITDVE